MKQRKKKKPTNDTTDTSRIETLRSVAHMYQQELIVCRRELEDSNARHSAGTRVIQQQNDELRVLRTRAENAEKLAERAVKAFEATLNMVRGAL